MLKHPKNPVLNNNNISLLKKFNATKIPKKNDDIKFIIEVFCILKPILILKLFCIYILAINPKVLPNKIINIDFMLKIYIFIHPFVTLLGSSNNLLEANSTLTQISFSFTFQSRKTDKVVPTLSNNNSLAIIPGEL